MPIEKERVVLEMLRETIGKACKGVLAIELAKLLGKLNSMLIVILRVFLALLFYYRYLCQIPIRIVYPFRRNLFTAASRCFLYLSL